MSENISAAIAVNGEIVMKQPLIKSMRVVKKETLKLISNWVNKTSDHQMVSFLAHKLVCMHMYIYVYIYIFPLIFSKPKFFSLIYFIRTKYIHREISLTGIGKLYTAVTGRCFTGLPKDECSLC